MNLDHSRFRVSATADNGVVSSETLLTLQQRGIRILGRYGGGSIARGYLVGTLKGTVLQWTTRVGSGTNTFDQVSAADAS